MSDTARDIELLDNASPEGLDDLFEIEASPDATQVLPGEGLPSATLFCSVEEAAQRLNVSPRTVVKKLRKGSLAGFKSQGKYGEKWVVSLEGLPSATLEVEEVSLGATQVLPGEVLPSATLSTDIDSAVQEPEIIGLLPLFEKQSKELQAAYWRNGRLETLVEELEARLSLQQEQIKLLTDSQHKPGWWQRVKEFFYKH